MKTSIFPLIILLVVCFALSFFVKGKESFKQDYEVSQVPQATELPKNNNVVTETVLNSFLPFSRYEESFVLRDESGKTYDVPEGSELFNVDGELKIGKHDSTDYASALDNVKNKYEEIKNQPPARCNEPNKCIADFATQVGEPLCCGQTGVLQDTRYVCPPTKPTCSKFKCGSEFGTCS